MMEDIVVNEMHRNLAPPPGVVPSEGLVISEPESGIFFYSDNFDLNAIKIDSEKADEMYRKMIYVIEARDDCVEARKIVQDNLDNLASSEGHAECKASASYLKRIQVKDIVKEIEDSLKTYSSAGMDIIWRDVSKNGRVLNAVVLPPQDS
ncbi:hypothetical protein Tco_1523400 [Tanacetum coccineum]